MSLAKPRTKKLAPKILVVDDDSDLLALLSKWLTDDDLKVVTADCGKDALAQINMERPDLVITDLIMDEIELYRERRG